MLLGLKLSFLGLPRNPFRKFNLGVVEAKHEFAVIWAEHEIEAMA